MEQSSKGRQAGRVIDHISRQDDTWQAAFGQKGEPVIWIFPGKVKKGDLPETRQGGGRYTS